MKNIIILLYHEVLEDKMKSGFQNNDNLDYMHDDKEFERHVFLVKKRIEFLENSNLQDEIYLTFDDGGVSNLVAASILERNHLKGIFFITTDKINQPFFLNEDQIRDLRKSGHIIGSHSHTHPMIFRTLKYDEMLQEWKKSKEILEGILKEEVVYCSVPGGDSDYNTYKSATEAGYKCIYDSEPIVKERILNKAKIFGRISIKKSTSDREVQDILELKNIKKLQNIRRLKSVVKRIAFPLHYYLQSKKNGK